MLLDQKEIIGVIEEVVVDFYGHAVNDILIGYHFRKLVSDKKSQVIQYENLGAFSTHIPKVVDFWCEQLIPEYTSTREKENLLKVHDYLNIRQGELGRWITLFKSTLDKVVEDEILRESWLEKVALFERALTKHYFSKNY